MHDLKNHPWRIISVVVVLLLAVTVWLVAVPLYHRHVALQELERLGGEIGYDSIAPDWLVDSGIDGWLRKVGIKLERVRSVDLWRATIANDTLRHIGRFTNLEVLMHSGAGLLNNAGAIQILNLTNRKSLTFDSSEVTDAGLVHLCNLTNLEVLDLSGTGITDDGLVHLCHFTNLEVLDLSGTGITNDGLVHLRHLTNLKLLELSGTDITEDGVKKLKESLSNCRINRQWPYF